MALLALIPFFELHLQQRSDFPVIHEDLRSAYRLVLQQGHEGDVVLTLSFPLKNWSPVELNLGSTIYFQQLAHRQHLVTADIASAEEVPLLDLYRRLKNGENIRNIFVIYQKAFDQVGLNFSGMNLETTAFDHLAVVKLPKNWLNFVDDLAAQPGLTKSWVMSLLLIQKDFLKRDQADFKVNYENFLQNIQAADNLTGIQKARSFISTEAQSIFSLTL